MASIIGLFIALLLVLEFIVRSNGRVKRHINPNKGVWAPFLMTSPKLLSLESHPYALYVKKQNCTGLYPSNSLGYTGKREISRERIPNSCRIYCVGGSTTEAHNPNQGPDSSWPGKMQDILAARFPGTSMECINAATVGYTSAESLSEFLFRGIDLKPDILLVYHNVNDAWTCQMVDGFKSDYSHARRHKSWDLGWVNRIPEISWVWTYQLVRECIMKRYGKSNALLYWISHPPWTLLTASLY